MLETRFVRFERVESRREVNSFEEHRAKVTRDPYRDVPAGAWNFRWEKIASKRAEPMPRTYQTGGAPARRNILEACYVARTTVYFTSARESFEFGAPARKPRDAYEEKRRNNDPPLSNRLRRNFCARYN